MFDVAAHNSGVSGDGKIVVYTRSDVKKLYQPVAEHSRMTLTHKKITENRTSARLRPVRCDRAQTVTVEFRPGVK